MRKIQILSTVADKFTLETAARTFGELKAELNAAGYNMSNLRFLNEDRAELILDTTLLPSGDTRIFASPAKTKSGSSIDFDDLVDTIETILDEVRELKKLVRGLKSESTVALTQPATKRSYSSEEERELLEIEKVISGNYSVSPLCDEDEDDDDY